MDIFIIKYWLLIFVGIVFIFLGGLTHLIQREDCFFKNSHSNK
jgi:uncharacterized membrane protein